MTTSTPAVNALANKIGGARSGFAELDEVQQRHALALLRTLARGVPVSVAALAIETDADPEQLDSFIKGLPGVFRDDDGRVVGFWGLTVLDFGPHRYRIGGEDLWAWCAWDPLILTPWLGGSAHVDSVDPNAREPLGLDIVDGEIVETSHPELTLSFKEVTEWTGDVVTSFCHFIHFFVDRESAEAWTRQRPGTFPLSLDDGLRLAEEWGRAVFPALDPKTA